MSITTYAELQTALGNWINRSDLTSRLPEFIALAEATMRRELRDKKAVGALNMTAGVATVALPSTVKELETMRYHTGTYEHPLLRRTPAALADVFRTGTGMPLYFTVVDGTVYFDVAADSAYTTQITYVEKIVPLSAGNTTNSTLTNSPDIYLYGALMQAAPFLEHDERVALWAAALEKAMDAENIYRERSELAGGPVQMRLPTVFGDPV